jgi:hypothetical protein
MATRRLKSFQAECGGIAALHCGNAGNVITAVMTV